MGNANSVWKISETSFPHSGSDEERLKFCLQYAILAPSTYNTQPWYFSISKNKVFLYADRRYALAVIDPDDREMSMACAAALYNLRLAIRAFGYQETTTLLPDKDNADLYASVKIGKRFDKRDEAEEKKDIELFQMITKRHTNRGAFKDKDVPEDILRKLKTAASYEGAALHICNKEERDLVLKLIAEGDHIQNGDKHFRRELAAWTDKRRKDSRDGLPDLGIGYKQIMNSFAPSVARRFEGSDGQAANDIELDKGSPTIAIIGSAKGGLLQRLHVGQAWMRTLLEAEKHGLSISFLNQPCEVPELRLRLHDELSQHGRAHIILRIGYGDSPEFSDRRALESSIVAHEASSSEKSSKTAAKAGFLGKFKKMLSSI